jgi:hypothetical protein
MKNMFYTKYILLKISIIPVQEQWMSICIMTVLTLNLKWTLYQKGVEITDGRDDSSNFMKYFTNYVSKISRNAPHYKNGVKSYLLPRGP